MWLLRYPGKEGRIEKEDEFGNIAVPLTELYSMTAIGHLRNRATQILEISPDSRKKSLLVYAFMNSKLKKV